MTEQKRLKDLKQRSLTVNFYDEKVVLISDLKAEAIKRIKTCKNIIITELGSVLCGESLLKERCHACKRDIWFYDLNEDDLKGGNKQWKKRI